MSSHVTVEVVEQVATVTLQSLTMPPAFFEELDAQFRALAAHDEVRVAIVRGAGKDFCHGLDLTHTFREHGALLLEGGLAAQRSELHQLIRRWQASVEAVAACPVPVIAAVHGWCIGGGLDLISACDIRLASADARFSLRETRMAMVADLGSLQRLPAIIGRGHARELAFTGGDIGAERAAQIGLINHLCEDRGDLEDEAAKMAQEIARHSPLAVRGAKAVLDFSEGKSVADGLAYAASWNAAFLASEDLAEAVTAFAQKREPQFKGR
jgi:enoyl-CoA hydratase